MKSSLKYLGAALILLSATGCGISIDGLRKTRPNPFCVEYPSAEKPIIWFEDNDTQDEVRDKTNLIIFWETQCGIPPG